MNISDSVKPRFWKYTHKTCGCWLWIGHRSEKGYGLLSVERRPKRAHRISWEIHCGPIPSDLQVLHRCDTPACVSPDHLFLGTNEDNHNDKLAKQRQGAARGERAGQVKLTEDQVREILTSSLKPAVLVRKYGISLNHVYAVRARRKWAHVQI